MERKHPLGPRLGAWVLDNILIMVATGLVLMAVFGASFRIEAFLSLAERFPGLQTQYSRLQELAVSLEQAGFTPEEERLLERVFSESFGATAEGGLPQDIWGGLDVATDPGAALSGVLERALSLVKDDPRLSEIDPGKLAQLSGALDTVSQLVSQVRTEEVFGIALEILRGLALWIFLVPAVYFALEAVFGFSLGKLLFGLRIIRQAGDGVERGNMLLFLLRYVLKASGWLAAAAGIYAGNVLVLAIGLGVNIVMGLSGFGVLNESFQTLYDGLSGTGVATHKELRKAEGMES